MKQYTIVMWDSNKKTTEVINFGAWSYTVAKYIGRCIFNSSQSISGHLFRYDGVEVEQYH